jgi:predicted  nucleic acid-binding Zn-ribbon protein
MELYLVTTAFTIMFFGIAVFMYMTEKRARSSHESEKIREVLGRVEHLQDYIKDVRETMYEIRDKQVDRNSEFYEMFNEHTGQIAIIKSDIDKLNERLNKSELQLNQLLSFRKQHINSLQEQLNAVAIAPTKRE